MLARSMSGLLQMELSKGEAFLVQDILLRLLREAETELRQSLALYLAEEEKCPQALIDYLVFECGLNESEYFLKNSPALSDDFLIEVAKRFATPAYWSALAMRKKIGPGLALHLVYTKDDRVHHILLRNQGATFCPQAMQILTDIAIEKWGLQIPLLDRKELTPDLAARLYWHVSESIKQDILQRFKIAPEVLERAMGYVVPRTIVQRSEVRTISMEMLGLVQRMRNITSRQIVDALHKGDRAMFACLCGVRLHVPPENILLMLDQDLVRGMAALCRAVHLTRADFSKMFLAWRRMDTLAAVTRASDLTSAVAVFDRTNMKHAEEALEHARQL